MDYQKINPSEVKNYNFSFWQSVEWLHILQDSSQAQEVFYFGNLESTIFLVEIRSVWLNFSAAFILWLQKSQLKGDYEKCLSTLKDFLIERGIIFLQIEPLDEVKFWGKTLTPLKKFITPFTRTISLEQTIEEILENMHQKGRYAVRNALKKWVEIQIEDILSEKTLDSWMSLISDTTKRDGFSHNSRKYYQKFLQILGKNVKILSAVYNGEIISMIIMVFAWDVAYYYYGASSSDTEARKLASSYLLLLKSMELAQQEGKKKFDLLWVADPNNENDPLSGVSQFKEKLGGTLEKLPKKFLFPLSIKFYIYRVLVGIKRKFL